MNPVAGAAIALIGGAVAGGSIRLLLGRLRRGVRVPAGPVEAVTAVVCAVGVAGAWGRPVVVGVVWLGLFGVALGTVDATRHRLPDAITLPGIAIAAALMVGGELLVPDLGSPPRALISAAVVSAGFAATALATPAAMGWGDVKLVVSLAAVTGYLSVTTVLIWLCLAFVAAALVAAVGMATGRWTLRSAVPLGPFLLAGAWFATLLPV